MIQAEVVKGDEGRPRCANCISKGFECRYAAAFQILGKNNFTPEVPIQGGYRELQVSYILSELLCMRFPVEFKISLCYFPDEQCDAQTSWPSTSSSGRKYANLLQFVSERNNKNDFQDIEEEDEKVSHVGASLSPASRPERPQSLSPKNVRNIGGMQGTTTQSPSTKRYEFALHGLIALGNASGADVEKEAEVNLTSLDVPETERLTLSADITMNQFQTNSNATMIGNLGTPKLHSWQSMSALSPIEVPHMTDERVLECLEHYRYNIAPWVSSSLFGRTNDVVAVKL